MSLPPQAEWIYDFKPEKGCKEEETLSMLKKDFNWI
jgi:coproporphyrinogen III oxidase